MTKRMWLNLSLYGLRLFMVRQAPGQSGGHRLVATGPGISNHRDSLSKLGFVRESRIEREYWVRALAGINNGVILGAFPNAAFEEMTLEQIMPTVHRAQSSALNTLTSSNSAKAVIKNANPTTNDKSPTPGDGSGSAILARPGRVTTLGASDARADASSSPSNDQHTESGGEVKGVSPQSTKPALRGVRTSEQRVADEESLVRERLTHRADGLAESREGVRDRDGSTRPGEQPESLDGRKAGQLIPEESTAPELDQQELIAESASSEILEEPIDANSISRRVNDNAEEAKKLVNRAAITFEATLGDWDLSDAVGHWEYSDFSTATQNLRVGVSGGGVISINGSPHTKNLEVIDTLSRLTEALSGYLPSPTQSYSVEYRINQGDWLLGPASGSPESAHEALPRLVAAIADGMSIPVESIEARVVDDFTGDSVQDTKAELRPANDKEISLGALPARVTHHAAFKELPAGWVVMNASRPMIGDLTLEDGPFLAGRFYAALDPESTQFLTSMAENASLDGRVVLTIPKDVQTKMALLDNKYSAEYLDEYEGEDLYKILNLPSLFADWTVDQVQAQADRALRLAVPGIAEPNVDGSVVTTDQPSSVQSETPERGFEDILGGNGATDNAPDHRTIAAAPDQHTSVPLTQTASIQPPKQLTVQEDDQASEEVDRLWRGLTQADLLASHRSSYITVFTAQNAMSALADSEADGLQALSISSRRNLLGFFGWGSVAQQVRVDNTRDSKNDAGRAIAKKIGMEEGEFNRHVLTNRLESFYTPAPLIQSMWQAVKHLGVSPESKVLDAGCGSAYFFVGAPEEFQRHARMVGVECDAVAARTAKQVAPDAVIVNSRYEQAILAKDFDLVVGNVPFGETLISDRNYKGASHIHDYFIVKSLDHLAVGGVMAVITSSGTMDKKSDTVRKQIMERANLVAAFRLPDDVFELQSANVTTDILILQKRPAGTRPDFDFTSTQSISIESEDESFQYEINQYFLDNPQHVLGNLTSRSSQYGPKLSVKDVGGLSREQPVDMLSRVARMLDVQVQNLPEGIRNRSEWPLEEARLSAYENPRALAIENATELLDYSGFVGDFIEQNGELVEVLDIVNTYDDNGIQTGVKHLTAPLAVTKEGHLSLLKDYIKLRDTTRRLMEAQLSGTEAELLNVQSALGDLYEAFVAEYGPLNKAANRRVYADDAGSAEVLALEVWDENTESLVKIADAFTQRVIGANPKATIESAEDAYFVSWDQRGQIDFPYMSQLSGISEDDLRLELIGNRVFINPKTGLAEPHHQYLSGNVVKKLEVAQEALKTSDIWERNVRALVEVQPTPVPFGDIVIRLGSSWIPQNDIRLFTQELFSLRGLSVGQFNVHYNPEAGMWTVDVSGSFKSEYQAQRSTLFGTQNMAYETLLEKLLNNQRPTHMVKVDGRQVVDDEATMSSRAKQDEINDKFHRWVASDVERAEKYADLYNSCTNVFVLPKVDGSRLTFPGLSPTWSPRAHQSDFVATTMMGFNALAAHPVGAGKTFEMVAAAIKLKQLGMVAKPMIAVPNNMLGQIAREAKQMYPGARILMVDRADLRGSNRERFLAIARNNDWDLIVCTHSLLNGISAPLNILTQEIKDDIQVLEWKIGETDSKRVERQLVAKLRSTQSRLEDTITKFTEAERREGVLTMDRLGVDCLFLDEAHLYKNLELNSAINVLGVTTGGSNRAWNLWGLSQYFRELHGKSFGLFEFTGTSISNTMCELYVHNKYLRPDLLEEMGIHHFDEWANRFGEVVSGLEALPEGGGFRVQERFGKFVNLPELLKLYRSFADVRTKSELNLPTPKVHTHVITVDQSLWQKAHMTHLSIRAIRVRGKGGVAALKEDNMLSIGTSGRKASLDMRLVASDIPPEASLKLAAVAGKVFEKYQQTHEVKGTQLVFMDLGTPGVGKEFSCYDELKSILVAKGVPSDEIAFIHEAKTDDQKEALFSRVRSGQVRILEGSTEKMGVGTNVQERLCAIHHVDCPYRPSDIEQRKGRVDRQGNLYFTEVDEYRYTTKDSFDLFMWETNKRKADFINQALSNPDLAGRVVSEEMDLGYAEVMAITTGNPKIREKVEVDDRVNKLERAWRVWLADASSRRSALFHQKREAQFLTKMIGAQKSIIEALPQVTYKSIEVKGSIHDLQDGSTTWLYATEAGKALKARLIGAETQLMRSNEKSAPLNISIGRIELRLCSPNAIATGRDSLFTSGQPMVAGFIEDEPLPTMHFTPSNSDRGNGAKLREWYDAAGRAAELASKLELVNRQILLLSDNQDLGDWAHQAELDELKAKKLELDTWFAAQETTLAPSIDPFEEMLNEYRESVAIDADQLEQFSSNPQEMDVSGLFGNQPTATPLDLDYEQEPAAFLAPTLSMR